MHQHHLARALDAASRAGLQWSHARASAALVATTVNLRKQLLHTPASKEARCLAFWSELGGIAAVNEGTWQAAIDSPTDAEAVVVELNTASADFPLFQRVGKDILLILDDSAYRVGVTDTPWEPPLAGSELDHLIGALERLRTTFRWKADDLDAAGLHTRIGASALTIGGLLKHLAITEDYIFTRKLSGEPVGDPWESLWDGTDDWEFTSAAHDPPDQLYAFWDEAVQRSRARLDAALAQGGLDQLVHVSSDDGEHASLRRLLCDLIEEYGRHTGHADLLREAVDRRVGEDPPPGWRPVSGWSN